MPVKSSGFHEHKVTITDIDFCVNTSYEYYMVVPDIPEEIIIKIPGDSETEAKQNFRKFISQILINVMGASLIFPDKKIKKKSTSGIKKKHKTHKKEKFIELLKVLQNEPKINIAAERINLNYKTAYYYVVQMNQLGYVKKNLHKKTYTVLPAGKTAIDNAKKKNNWYPDPNTLSNDALSTESGRKPKPINGLS